MELQTHISTCAHTDTSAHTCAHTQEHVNTCAHTETSGHVCTHTETRMNACTCVHRHQDVYVCTQTPLSTFMWVLKHIRPDMCTHTHCDIRTCMCAQIDTHEHTHAHTVTSGHARVHTLRHIRPRMSEHRHTQHTCVHTRTHTPPQQLPIPSCGCRHTRVTRGCHWPHAVHTPGTGDAPTTAPSAPSEHRRDVGWQKIISFPAWPRGSGNKKLPSSQPISKALDTCVSASEDFLSSSHGKGNSPSLLITHDRSCACLQ